MNVYKDSFSKRPVEIATILILLGVIGYVATSHFRNQLEAYKVESAVLKSKLSSSEEKLAETLKTIAKMDLDLATKDKKIKDLQASLPPVPKPPDPVPVENADLASGLSAMGLSRGLVVLDAGSTALLKSDASLAFQWGQQASRVPGLELRIQKDTELQSELVSLTDEFKVRIKTGDQALTESQQALAISKHLTITTEQALASQKKLGTMKVIKWGTIGLSTGFIIGKLIK